MTIEVNIHLLKNLRVAVSLKKLLTTFQNYSYQIHQPVNNYNDDIKFFCTKQSLSHDNIPKHQRPWDS